MTTTTRKVGGSLMATIPKEMVKELGLKENQAIHITVEPLKKSYFGSLKDLKPWNRKKDREMNFE